MKLPFAVLVFCAVVSYAGTLKPVATVPLPCESSAQVPSPTGGRLAVRCKDHSLRLVELPSGKELHLFEAAPRIYAYAFSPDGRAFAVGYKDGSVDFVKDDNAPTHVEAANRGIVALQFTPDAKFLVVGPNDLPAQIWNISGQPHLVANLRTPFSGLTAIAISPDGKLLVTADGDTIVRFYETATWKQVREYRGFLLETFGLAFTADGKSLLAGGADRRVTVLDPATATVVRTLPERPDYVVDLQSLADNHKAVAMYEDPAGRKQGYAFVWDLGANDGSRVDADPPLTGGGVVNGKLWCSRASGSSLQVFSYE